MKKEEVLFLKERGDILFTSREPLNHRDYVSLISQIKEKTAKPELGTGPAEYKIETFNAHFLFSSLTKKYSSVILLCDYTKTLKKVLLIVATFFFRTKQRIYWYEKSEYQNISPAYLSVLLFSRPLQSIKLNIFKFCVTSLIEIVSMSSSKMFRNKK